MTTTLSKDLSGRLYPFDHILAASYCTIQWAPLFFFLIILPPAFGLYFLNDGQGEWNTSTKHYNILRGCLLPFAIVGNAYISSGVGNIQGILREHTPPGLNHESIFQPCPLWGGVCCDGALQIQGTSTFNQQFASWLHYGVFQNWWHIKEKHCRFELA